MILDILLCGFFNIKISSKIKRNFALGDDRARPIYFISDGTDKTSVSSLLLFAFCSHSRLTRMGEPQCIKIFTDSFSSVCMAATLSPNSAAKVMREPSRGTKQRFTFSLEFQFSQNRTCVDMTASEFVRSARIGFTQTSLACGMCYVSNNENCRRTLQIYNGCYLQSVRLKAY